MKILRIIARLNVGGPARHVVWLTQGLEDDEFQSKLIAGTVPDGEEDMGYFAAENGVEPVFIPELSRELSLKDAVSLLKIYREIRRFAPDIIHTHTAKAGTVGRAAAFLYRWLTWGTFLGRPRRVAVVHTFHGHVFHSYYGKLKTRVFLAIEQVLARVVTDRIVVISGQQLDEISSRFGVGRRDQFSVIPLGIDLGAVEAAGERDHLRDEIGAAEDETVVGFVGRLTEIKNLGLMVDAAREIDALGTDAPRMRFVIIGDGNVREAVEHAASSVGSDGFITFLGNRPDVARLLAGLDILALTSRNEGTPLSLIEGMAAGVPFVSTAVGGVVDLAGEVVETVDNIRICQRGVLTDDNSVTSLTNGLLYLAKNEKLRVSISGAAHEFVAVNYSKDRLLSDIRSLYRELAE